MSSQTNLTVPAKVGGLLTHVERLAVVEKEVIADLENQTDEEILDTRNKAALLSKTAWYIEAACDAQIYARAQKVRRGRGNSDNEGVGVMAQVRKRAKLIGCTPQTIYIHSRIFNLIEEVNVKLKVDILQVLDEKGFYKAAILAADGTGALELFAEKKRTLPRFRVSDAFRILKSEGLSSKIVSAKAMISWRTASRKTIYTYLEKLKGVLRECPDTAIFNRLIKECYFDVTNSIEEMFDEDVSFAVKKAWGIDCQSEEQLSQVTGFPLGVISRVMGRLDDEFIKIPGSGSQRWHKVGQPLPEELRRRVG